MAHSHTLPQTTVHAAMEPALKRTLIDDGLGEDLAWQRDQRGAREHPSVGGTSGRSLRIQSSMNATLHIAIILHHFVSLNWPMITWRRISNSLRWAQRYGRTTTYFLLTPTSWAQGATLTDAPSILCGLIQLVMVNYASTLKATNSLTPSKSTAHEIRSPSPEDYYYSGHTERLLHVWNPRRLATKPPRTRKSIYAAATNDENHGRALNFRARSASILPDTYR